MILEMSLMVSMLIVLYFSTLARTRSTLTFFRHVEEDDFVSRQLIVILNRTLGRP